LWRTISQALETKDNKGHNGNAVRVVETSPYGILRLTRGKKAVLFLIRAIGFRLEVGEGFACRVRFIISVEAARLEGKSSIGGYYMPYTVDGNYNGLTVIIRGRDNAHLDRSPGPAEKVVPFPCDDTYG
jgi:hypothetical protein